MINQI